MNFDEYPEEFPLENFLAKYPEFSNPTVYPTALVERSCDSALLHITPSLPGLPMKGKYRIHALYLMAAHIIILAKKDYDLVSGGEGTATPGTEFKATIGTVTVERTKPNSFTVDDWSYWLNQTSYGRELLAYLDTRAPTGVFLNTGCDTVRDLI